MTTGYNKEEFVAARVWCADFSAAGYNHAGDWSEAPVRGYAYPYGFYIVDDGNGEYWCPTENTECTGTLAECEAHLWRFALLEAEGFR